MANLPEGSQVVADKGYISYQDEIEILAYLNDNVCLIPKYRTLSTLDKSKGPRVQEFTQTAQSGGRILHTLTGGVGQG